MLSGLVSSACLLSTVALWILLTWLACGLALVGIGSLVLSTFDTASLSEAFWTGLGGAVAILIVYHFYRPVDLWACILLCSLGLAGLIYNRTALGRQLRDLTSPGPYPLFIYILILFAISLRASSDWFQFDTGLYGASAVRWITAYPLVPGLANLHIRLAYNSSVFLCVALLDHGWWRVLAHHLFPGLPLSVLVASVLRAVLRLFRRTSAAASDWFASILAIPVGYHAFRGEIVGDITDLPATAACFAACLILFRELNFNSPEDEAESHRPQSLLIVTVLFVLAISFKLSVLMFATSGWLITLIVICRTAHMKENRRLVSSACLLSMAILIPWLIRGLILSGYPLYPSTTISVPVDWRVPLDYAKWESVGVTSWARIPGAGLAATRGFHWMNTWIWRVWSQREGFSIPFVLSFAGLVLAFLFERRRGLQKFPRWGLLLIPSACGVIFWFAAAPDPRFGEPAIWTMAATLSTLGIMPFIRAAGCRRNRIILSILLAIGVCCLLPARDLLSGYWGLRHVHELVRLPNVDVLPLRTQSGLTVFVPAIDDLCWDTALVCTPYFNKGLRLRRPGNLRWGFASDGVPEVNPYPQ